MNHRITIQVPVEKRGIFGRKKTVYEQRTITVDGPTYRAYKRAMKEAEQQQREVELDEFLDDMEIMEMIEEEW
jgi:Tfp pilus assembly ATPase PilU